MEMKFKKLGKYRFEKSYIYEEHQHPEYEINYIISGQCIMVLNGETMAFRKNDCAVIAPMRPHNFIVSGNQECQIMQAEFSHHSGRFPAEPNECIKLTNCTDVLDSLSHLYKYIQPGSKSEYYNKLFQLELEKLFVLIAMHADIEKSAEEFYKIKPMKDILKYLESHYNHPINLDALAQSHNISSRYLRKLFVQTTGMSAIDYITALRLEKAKDLLKNSNLSISKIAFDVGYNSAPYFSAIFKEKISITPKEFRNQYTI